MVSALSTVNVVLDSMDHSFREVDDAAAFLGAPSLGAIHVIETPPEQALRRRKFSGR